MRPGWNRVRRYFLFDWYHPPFPPPAPLSSIWGGCKRQRKLGSSSHQVLSLYKGETLFLYPAGAGGAQGNQNSWPLNLPPPVPSYPIPAPAGGGGNSERTLFRARRTLTRARMFSLLLLRKFPSHIIFPDAHIKVNQ